jgi:hypothetical protein
MTISRTPILNTLVQQDTATYFATVASLNRLDALLASTGSTGEECLALVELIYEDAKTRYDNRAVFNWYREARAAAGNPVIRFVV